MSSSIQTRLGGIALPPGFVQVESKDPFHFVYFDYDVLNPVLEAGKVIARFKDVTHFCIVTYNNKRRPGTRAKSEEHMDSLSAKQPVCLLQEMLARLVGLGNPIQDGHDAFIFTQALMVDGVVPRLDDDIALPKAYAGNGSYWRLIGVIERT
jgi:hypothetical protein